MGRVHLLDCQVSIMSRNENHIIWDFICALIMNDMDGLSAEESSNT